MIDALESIRAELSALEAAGLRRRMRPIDSAQTAELVVDGRRAINFSSNNYLGFADHPALSAAAFASAQSEGFGSGSSRLIAGSLASHRSFERALATWFGSESALLFSSGFQANLGVIPALLREGDAVFSDALNHASIIDGCRLSGASIQIYPHLSLADLDRSLMSSSARRKLIVTESLFSMDGDVAPVGALAALAKRHGALLMIDDAHAVGALGPQGRGLTAGLPVDVVMGTLGKAFGIQGAFVAAAAPIIDLLVQRARSFVFSTALPTVTSSSGAEALSLIQGPEGDLRRTLLRQRCEQLQLGLRDLGLRPGPPSHIQPVFVRGGEPGRAMSVSETLLARGLFVQGIRTPTVPRGTSRLRISAMSTHTSAHIDSLLRGLASVRSELAAPDEIAIVPVLRRDGAGSV